MGSVKNHGPPAIILNLLLGSWVVRGADGQEQTGHLSTVALCRPGAGRLGDQPLGNIDGIEPDGRGGYTVTDWATGDVLHVSPGGKPTPLVKLRQAPPTTTTSSTSACSSFHWCSTTRSWPTAGRQATDRSAWPTAG